jgi:hypothetical protein
MMGSRPLPCRAGRGRWWWWTREVTGMRVGVCGMGDWTMMRWDDGWDAEPRRAIKPFGKPWKLVLAPVNHLRKPWKLVALPAKHLERKTFGALRYIWGWNSPGAADPVAV